MKALDENILARYFAEEANPEELALVNDWLLADEKNTKELKEYHVLWLASQKPVAEFKVDVDKAWEKVEAKTRTKPKANNFMLRIAAAVVGVLLISTYFLVNRNQEVDYLSLKSEKASEIKTLADGSTVTLNSFSLLEFPDAFDGDERRIKLIGEAFFNITPNPDKPFIIEANGTEIRVLGTSFNISARDEDVKVSVNTGTVEFTKSTKNVILKKGEEATYQSLRDTIKTARILDRNIFAHKTKIFEFNDTQIEEVVNVLNKGYQSNIELQGNNWAGYVLTTRFENENLADALGIIAETLELNLQNSNKTYIFAKKN